MNHRFEEPCEVWRMTLRGGRVAHAMVVPRGLDVDVLWFIDGVPQDGTTVPDWEGAVRVADTYRLQAEAERSAIS
jgi:hypothetical protein